MFRFMDQVWCAVRDAFDSGGGFIALGLVLWAMEVFR